MSSDAAIAGNSYRRLQLTKQALTSQVIETCKTLLILVARWLARATPTTSSPALIH